MKTKESLTRCFTGILATIIASYSFCGCGEDSESSAYVSDNATNTVAESTNSLTLETADSSSPEESDAVEPQESAESSSSTLSISSEQGTAESDAESVEVTTTVTTTKPVEVTTAVTTTEPVENTTTTTTTTQPVEVEPETEKAEFSPVTDFEYTITDGEVIINLYMGTDSTVIIPSEIEDCPVIGIERINGCESVFHPGTWIDDSGMQHNGNSTVTEIIIPDDVRYIGDGAFVKCWALTSIIIPDGVTSIGSSAFYECTQLTSITIPDTVTSIGDKAFDGRVCPSVTYKDQVYDTSENYIAVFNAINNR